LHVAITLGSLLIAAPPATAGELPYFVTYSHHLEEPGNLEIGFNQVAANPEGGNAFLSELIEFEYGVTAWWTTELYLGGQSTRHESAVFTGYRIEHRFRPLWREHRVNPLLYVEYSNGNGADKTFGEIVGRDSAADAQESNAETREEREREIETRLILSSDVRGWNISENLIAEKNLAGEPWEFGYALGVSRPLRMAATPEPCSFCRENFRASVELFGGLGDWRRFGLAGTSHYLGPGLAWELPTGVTLAFSPAFGLNGNSHRVLWRFAVAYEFNRFGRNR
jgi:hypothetical protein